VYEAIADGAREVLLDIFNVRTQVDPLRRVCDRLERREGHSAEADGEDGNAGAASILGLFDSSRRSAVIILGGRAILLAVREKDDQLFAVATGSRRLEHLLRELEPPADVGPAVGLGPRVIFDGPVDDAVVARQPDQDLRCNRR